MEDDVFDDHDGVVDDETDGGCETTEGHQVEALAGDIEEDEGDQYGDGYDEAGDERGTPVAQEDDDDDGGEDDADQDGVAHAGDAVADQLRLVVEGLEVDAGRKVGLEAHDLGGDLIGDLDGVAGGLAGDVQQDGGLAVGANHGVDGLDSVLDVGNIGDFDGNAGGAVLDDDLSKLFDAVDLGADEAEDELMVGFVEAGGVEQVGGVDGVDEIGDGDAGEQQFCGVGSDRVLRAPCRPGR